ncbi:MAG TPA: hemolysin III family protein [Anaerolineaceae bacterium]|nr:hemolysin III family protein [Anaerolineaceae bacterium]
MSIKLREPINAITHLLAAGISTIGLLVLLYFGWGQPIKLITFLVYGISLILLFSASGLYHAVSTKDSTIMILRKFDHSAIYLLIAGSYTPICIYFFEGFWQYGMIALIWFLAIVGILIKIFIIKSPRWVTAGIYLLMGWLSILGVEEIIRSMPAAAISWLVMGGLMYTIGAIIYITKKLDFKPGIFGFHEVWHIFVILGAFFHYYLILRFIALVS